MNGLGALFERLSSHSKLWRSLFFVLLVLLVALNLAITPEEAHFGLDRYPGFFAGFAFVVGLVLLIVLEKIVRPLIARKEDFYGDI